MKKHSQFILTFLTSLIFLSVNVILTSQSCPSGMVSYWKLEETSESNFEDSFGENDGTTSSRPLAIKGRSDVGMAQYFDGSSAYIDVPAISSLNWSSSPVFTIEFWVKYTTVDVTRVMIGSDSKSNQAQWWVGTNTAGRIRWFIRDGDVSNGDDQDLISGSSVHNNQWHHIALVKNGSSSKIYIDGVLSNSTTTGFSANIGTGGTVNLGYLNVSGPEFHFDGALDEIAIYNSALSEALIAEHYTNGNPANGYGIGYCDGNTPVIVTKANEVATVGSPYTYDVDASGNPKPTYELVTYPSGMTINENTGVISWTPGSISDNGQVTVRANNSEGSDPQNFTIFLASTPDCRTNVDAYWSFNENSSAAFVDDINGYTFTGTSSYASGILEGGRSFNGTNDSLNLKDPEGGVEAFFDFNNGSGVASNFSIEFWMKKNGAPVSNMVILGRNEPENSSSYWIGVNTNGEIQAFFRDYNGPSYTEIMGGSVVDDNWHHVVVTYDNGTDDLIIYVDAINVASANQYFDDFGGNDPLTVGWFDVDPYYFYEGGLDELTVYNKALSAAEVSNNYGSGSPSPTCEYNYAPAITSPPVTTGSEDVAYTYNITADDIDGDDITLSAVTKPDWLTFNYTAGNKTASLTGTPDGSEVGSYPVTIRVSDGSVNVDQDYTLVISNVNDAPVITSNPDTIVLQDDPYNYTLTATDEDEDDLTFSAPVKPTWLSFNASTGLLSGTPTNSEVGDHSVTLRVDDGTTQVDQSFTITVDDENDIPVIEEQVPLETDEDTPITISLDDITVTDVDNTQDQLTLVIQNGSHYTYSGLTITPEENYDSDITVNIVVEDLVGSSEVFGLLISINPTNDAPVITSIPITTATEDIVYGYTLEAEDPDQGDDVTKSVIQKPSWLTFTAASGLLAGTPLNEHVGENNIILRVTDGKSSVDQEFTIIVTNTNDPPEFTSSPVTTADDYEEYTYNVEATDIDVGDDVTLSVISKPSWLIFNASTGVLSGTPKAGDANKNFDVELKASDGSDNTSQIFTITVGNNNSLPVVTSTAMTEITEGNTYSYTFTADDEDEDDVLSFTSINIPPWLTFIPSSSNGVLTGNPTNENVGEFPIVLQVSDGRDDVSHSFTIQVIDQNEPPEITSIPPSDNVDQDVLWSYTIVAEDPDPDEELTYSVQNIPGWLSFNNLTHELKGTPVNEYADSTFNITIEVSDDDGLSDSQTFPVTVNNINDPPEITSDPELSSPVDEEDLYTYTFKAIDIDKNDVLTLKAVTKPKWLSFDPATGVLSGTPDDENVGESPVKLSASDGTETVIQEFVIIVNPVNDPPVFIGQNPIELNLSDGESLEISITAYLFMEDPDNSIDELTLTVLPGANYSVNGNVITPVSSFTEGQLSVNCRVRDLEDQIEFAVKVDVLPNGINEIVVSDLIGLAYPNPVEDNIFFKYNLPVSNTRIQIFDISGKIVKEIETDAKDNLVSLNLSELHTGVYFYKVYVDQKVQIGKFNKQ